MSNRQNNKLRIETERMQNQHRIHSADLRNAANNANDVDKNGAPLTPAKPGQQRQSHGKKTNKQKQQTQQSAFAQFGIPAKPQQHINRSASGNSDDVLATPSTMASSSASPWGASAGSWNSGKGSQIQAMWGEAIPEDGANFSRPSPPPSPSNYHAVPAGKNPLRQRVSNNIQQKVTEGMPLVNAYERNWLDAQETLEGADTAPYWSTQLDWSVQALPNPFASIDKRSEFDQVLRSIDWSVAALPKAYNDALNYNDLSPLVDWSSTGVPYETEWGWWDAPRMDWTFTHGDTGLPRAFSKENNWHPSTPTFQRLYKENEPLSLDWSVDGALPHIFQAGSKRTASKPTGDQPQLDQEEELAIDWSVQGKLPVKFRYWDYDLALDWSAAGMPLEGEELKRKETKKKSKWDPLVLDWSVSGIPDKITHAPWKQLFPMSEPRKEFNLAIDWSVKGLPKVFKKLSFNNNERKAKKHAKAREIMEKLEKIDWSNTQSIWKLLDNPATGFNANLQLEHNEPVKVGNYEIQLGTGEVERIVEQKYNHGNIPFAVDWSVNGLPAEPKRGSLFDRELAFDWSAAGVPHIFQVGSKRGPSEAELHDVLLEKCCSDLFNEVTNYKLHDGYKNKRKRDWQKFESVDWAGGGLPIKERKLWDNMGSYMDWTAKGLPSLFVHAQWQNKYGSKYVPLRKAGQPFSSNGSDVILNLDKFTTALPFPNTRIDLKSDVLFAYNKQKQDRLRQDRADALKQKYSVDFQKAKRAQHAANVNLSNDYKSAYGLKKKAANEQPVCYKSGGLRLFNPAEARFRKKQAAARPAAAGAGLRLYNAHEAAWKAAKAKIPVKTGTQKASKSGAYKEIEKGKGMQKYSSAKARVRDNDRLFPKREMEVPRGWSSQVVWEQQASAMSQNRFTDNIVTLAEFHRGPVAQPYRPASYHVCMDPKNNRLRPKGYVPVRDRLARSLSSRPLLNDYERAWLDAQESEADGEVEGYAAVDWGCRGIPSEFTSLWYQRPNNQFNPSCYHLVMDGSQNRVRPKGYVSTHDKLAKSISSRPILNAYEQAWLQQQENEADDEFELVFDWSLEGTPEQFSYWHIRAQPLEQGPKFDANYLASLRPYSGNKCSWAGGGGVGVYQPSSYHVVINPANNRMRPKGYVPIRDRLAQKLCNRKIMNDYEKAWLLAQEREGNETSTDYFWDNYALDFSLEGLPDILGGRKARRAKERAWQARHNDEELVIDWAFAPANKMPHQFRALEGQFWNEYDAAPIDWSVSGLPKEINEHVPGTRGSFLGEELVLDWSTTGVPEQLQKIANAPADRNCLRNKSWAEKRDAFFSNPGILDWSQEGIPQIIQNGAKESHESARQRNSFNRCPECFVVDFSAKGAPLRHILNWTIPKGSAREDTSDYVFDWSSSGVPAEFRANTFFDEDNLGSVLDWSSSGLPVFLEKCVSTSSQRKTLREHQPEEKCWRNWAKTGVANVRELFAKDTEITGLSWNEPGLSNLSTNVYVNPGAAWQKPRNGSWPLGSSGKVRKPNSNESPYVRQDRRFWSYVNEADKSGDCGAVDWSQSGVPTEDPIKFLGAKHGKTFAKFLRQKPKKRTYIELYDEDKVDAIVFDLETGLDWGAGGLPYPFGKSTERKKCYTEPLDWSESGLPYQLKMGGERASFGMTRESWERNFCNVDWSDEGLDARLGGCPDLFEGTQFDWSKEGIPKPLRIGFRTAEFEDNVASMDWSVSGLPNLFRRALHPRNGEEGAFVSVDWSVVNELPIKPTSNNFFHKLANQETSFDWSCRGLPRAGGASPGRGNDNVQNRFMGHAVLIDWSGAGIPAQFTNVNFFEQNMNLKNYDANLNLNYASHYNHQPSASRTEPYVEYVFQFASTDEELATLARSADNIKPENFKKIRNAPDTPSNKGKDQRREARHLNRVSRSKKTKRNLRHLMVTEAKFYQTMERRKKDKWQKQWRHQQQQEKELKNHVFTFDKVPNEYNIVLDYSPVSTDAKNRLNERSNAVYETVVELSDSGSGPMAVKDLNNSINENRFSRTAIKEKEENKNPNSFKEENGSKSKHRLDNCLVDSLPSDFANNNNNMNSNLQPLKNVNSDAHSWMLLSDPEYGYSVGSRSSMSASSRN